MFRTTGITKSTASGLAAIAIVSLAALAIEQGHAGGAPQGVVEVGTLCTEQVGEFALGMLPEVQVTGQRVYGLAEAVAAHDAGTRG